MCVCVCVCVRVCVCAHELSLLSDKGILMTFGNGVNGCLGHGNYDDASEVYTCVCLIHQLYRKVTEFSPVQPKLVPAMLDYETVEVACGADHVIAVTGWPLALYLYLCVSCQIPSLFSFSLTLPLSPSLALPPSLSCPQLTRKCFAGGEGIMVSYIYCHIWSCYILLCVAIHRTAGTG